MTTEALEQAFNLAVGHHQAGRLAEAEAIYRQILAQVPDHAEVLHLLGCLAGQTGHFGAAIDLIGRAVTLEPAVAAYQANLGESYRRAGQPERAILCLRRAIELEPCLIDVHNKLGVALKEAGRTEESITAFRRAIVLTPDSPEPYSNLGNALKETGAVGEAIAAYRRAIVLKPGFAEAYSNLGDALCAIGAIDEAIATYRRAIVLKPDHAEAHINLGNALAKTGAVDDGILAYRQAIDLKPGFAETHSNLGCALLEAGAVDDAIAANRRAIELKPEFAEAHSNLGSALQAAGALDDAIAAYRRAIDLKPSYAEGHFNLALMLLLRGDFPRGWAEYEWRWGVKGFPSPRWSYSQPQWDGSELADRTILLHCEQGFGDTIQFIRYVTLVAERCGNVIVTCLPEMHRLLQSMPGVARWILPGEPLPPFDVHCPLMSLPLALGTTLQTIPARVPYLQADSRGIERWRERVGPNPVGLKVGVAWAGSASHKRNYRKRSLPLSSLAPLAEVRGVNFYSLQKGEQGIEAKAPPCGMNLIDRTDELSDFADTAALVANLDLVVSVDTAVAHLAGALGKPAWILLPFLPDWRWLLEREDSPWYPTMRLFRQPAIGRWDEVIERVARCLAVHAQAGSMG